MVQAIDEWALGIATRASHWFQRLTGRTNYFLALLAIVACFASCIADILNYFRPVLAHPTNGPKLVMTFLTTIWITYYAMNLQREVDRSLVMHAEAKPSWVLTLGILRQPWFRVAVLLLAPLSPLDLLAHMPTAKSPLLEVVSQSYNPCFLLFLYFIEVSPLPPGRSRVREWADGLRALFARPAAESS